VRTKVSIEATCPDCRGPLSVVRIDDLVEIRCLVGHAYSVKALLQAHSEAQENALWAAAVALLETATIVECISSEVSPSVLERLRAQVEKKRQQAAAIQGILEDLDPFEG
jgi:two-component system chemotaxis response regulator CheB